MPPPLRSNTRGIVAVIGVGPRLGRAIAQKFAYEGYTVAILSRDLTKLSKIADEIAREAKAQVYAIRIDCSEAKSIHEAFEGVLSIGFVEVLVYNACSVSLPTPPVTAASVSLASLERALAVGPIGAFHCARKVIPGMAEKGKGTIIFTGSSASLTGEAGYCELSTGKFALRGLSQCLAKEHQASGIHVAHVVINGPISEPGSSSEDNEGFMDPDAIAQTYWQLHVQDKRAWAQEIDVNCFRNAAFGSVEHSTHSTASSS